MSNAGPEADEPQATGRSALIRVLAAVIHRDGRYLVCKRPSHKRHGGLWEFPGGKLERGESLDEAARRELKEELGVSVSQVSDAVYTARDPGSLFLIEFTPIQVVGVPQSLEHDEVRWVTREELGNLELAPADADFAASLNAGS